MGSNSILFILSFVITFQLVPEFEWEKTHTHTYTHTQHGNIIVLFLLTEESGLKSVIFLVSSCGCEAVTLKKEERMEIFEKRQLRRIFGP
jgi:hypothetical protein